MVHIQWVLFIVCTLYVCGCSGSPMQSMYRRKLDDPVKDPLLLINWPQIDNTEPDPQAGSLSPTLTGVEGKSRKNMIKAEVLRLNTDKKYTEDGRKDSRKKRVKRQRSTKITREDSMKGTIHLLIGICVMIVIVVDICTCMVFFFLRSKYLPGQSRKGVEMLQSLRRADH